MRLGRAPLAAASRRGRGAGRHARGRGPVRRRPGKARKPGSAAAPAVLSGARVALAASAAPALPAGAARLGAVPAQTTVRLDVALNVRDEAGLDALLRGLADKKSPYFDRFLHPGQFGAMFGPTLVQIAQVTAVLRELGLTPGAVPADRLSIPVTGTAAAVDRAFGISLVDYRLPGGRTAFANSAAPRVPAAVAPLIQGVLGLDTLYTEHSFAIRIPVPAAKTTRTNARSPPRPGAPPKPCTAAVNQALNDNALTAPQFASHYGISALYGMGDLGQGVHVAVAELEPNLASDISAYESCYGIHTAVRYFKVDGGAGSGAGSSEAALDIENIAGLAPGAIIDVYQAPNTVSDLYQDLNHIVSVDTDRVVSVSWGLCEADVTGAQLQAYQNAMKAANSQAQTMVVAAGDTGSTDCLAADKTKAAQLSVSSPASANYVDAVGGTTINGSALLAKETVWNGSSRTSAAGAGGGGVSILCMPNYQDYNQINHTIPVIPGLISARSQKNAACALRGQPERIPAPAPRHLRRRRPVHRLRLPLQGVLGVPVGRDQRGDLARRRRGGPRRRLAVLRVPRLADGPGRPASPRPVPASGAGPDRHLPRLAPEDLVRRQEREQRLHAVRPHQRLVPRDDGLRPGVRARRAADDRDRHPADLLRGGGGRDVLRVRQVQPEEHQHDQRLAGRRQGRGTDHGHRARHRVPADRRHRRGRAHRGRPGGGPLPRELHVPHVVSADPAGPPGGRDQRRDARGELPALPEVPRVGPLHLRCRAAHLLAVAVQGRRRNPGHHPRQELLRRQVGPVRRQAARTSRSCPRPRSS